METFYVHKRPFFYKLSQVLNKCNCVKHGVIDTTYVISGSSVFITQFNVNLHPYCLK